MPCGFAEVATPSSTGGRDASVQCRPRLTLHKVARFIWITVDTSSPSQVTGRQLAAVHLSPTVQFFEDIGRLVLLDILTVTLADKYMKRNVHSTAVSHC